MVSNPSIVQESLLSHIKSNIKPLDYLFDVSDDVIFHQGLTPLVYCFVIDIRPFFPKLKKSWYCFLIYCHTTGHGYLYLDENIYASEKECLSRGKNYLLQFPYYGFLKRLML